MVIDRLRVPIVLAPLAGGPATPALAAAVTRAGGLGFLAAGYRSRDQLAADLAAYRAEVDGPVGVNLFVPGPDEADAGRLESYAERIRTEAEALGAEIGPPAWTDDAWDEKLELVLRERPDAVSFTFGLPEPAVLRALTEAGVEPWVTVTEPEEAVRAAAAGAAVLVVQGVEAGGHRGSFADEDGSAELGLLPLIRLCRRQVELPLVAAGGLADGHAIAAVLVAGAAAAQLGTAFLDTAEAGTAAPHRERLRAGGRTRLTRAFSGRRARGLENRFLLTHSSSAPAAYPHVNSMTSALRAAGRAQGVADVLNLWAGQAHPLADHGVRAGDVMARLERELTEALGRARDLGPR